MKRSFTRRVLAALLAVLMVAAILPVSAQEAGEDGFVYTLNFSEEDLFKAGEKNVGEHQRMGTDKYFTLHYDKKTQVEAEPLKTPFADQFVSDYALRFLGGAAKITDEQVTNAIEFTTNGPARIDFWWAAGGSSRQLVIYDKTGNRVAGTPVSAKEGEMIISQLQLDKAGTYYIGNSPKVNFIYQIRVTEENEPVKVQRPAWSQVAAPTVTFAEKLNNLEQLQVNVSALIALEGGDAVRVELFDKDMQKLGEQTLTKDNKKHTAAFTIPASGKYFAKAYLSREGQQDKVSALFEGTALLPLKTPNMVSGTNNGGGSLTVQWTSVREADRYELYMDGTLVTETTGNSHTMNLTVGSTHEFYVKAYRGAEVTKDSAPMRVEVTEDARLAWNFTYYGPSTKAGTNGYLGDINEDQQVTVYSEGGKGKIQPNDVDGMAFYYTPISAAYNFRLRAHVHVDGWTFSNGQEGFGLLVTDRLGVMGDADGAWSNQYMALASKIEYRYDAELEETYPADDLRGEKYSMKLGLGVLAKTGVTKENLPYFEANQDIAKNLISETYTLETAAGRSRSAGTYNIIGNQNGVDDKVHMAVEAMTDFILEIERTPTGYVITYYAEDGTTVLSQRKFYDPDALNKLDEDFIYVGFFAARNARATFSNVELETILASEDPRQPEERPDEKIVPGIGVSSGSVITSDTYKLMFTPNVSGTVKISLEDEVIVESLEVLRDTRYVQLIPVPEYEQYRIRMEFTPDPDQDLGEGFVLSSRDKVHLTHEFTRNKGFWHRKVIYVSPTGVFNGDGTRENPLDIYTAVDNAVPGQTIVLTGEHYKLMSPLRIQRGMDGAEGQYISMIGDPESDKRPVLDFQRECVGIVHGADWWYFANFDVTNTMDYQKGFQVSGSYNVLDGIHAYRNGNTGIQICRLSSADTVIDHWPAYNLVLNCTSYYNIDQGREDADGFAAKLTVGPGNVFDGCIAHHNADDGWDLYAKVDTGSIGAVTIRNSVAYSNGIEPDDVTIGVGNGNGFKLGGANMSGKHVLENCYAFDNKAKGIDSNSCPDIIVRNCVTYNNGSYNVALYTNINGATTDFRAFGILSYKDENIRKGVSETGESFRLDRGESLNKTYNQPAAYFKGYSNYYWNWDEESGTGSSANSAGVKVTADMFKSLEFKGIVRNADGSINMQGFLERTDKTPADTGVYAGGTASKDVSRLPEDLACTYSDTWYIEDSQFHWRECECGDRGHYGAHTLTEIIDKEATPTQTGLKHMECTECGHKRPSQTVYYDGPAVNPTEPSQPTEPGTSGDPGQSGLPVAVIIAVAAVVVIGGAAAVMIVLKKKKK